MKYLIVLFVIWASCKECKARQPLSIDIIKDDVRIVPVDTASRGRKEVKSIAHPNEIDTKDITPQQLLVYAKSLIGTPYLYNSVDPAKGFDCSGFITYVFNHFNITVPRSSIGFTNVEKEISLETSKPGDIILFTGTNITIRTVGHMGIITSNTGEQVEFIHSTSGKAYGVTITPLNKSYKERLVKVIRVFP